MTLRRQVLGQEPLGFMQTASYGFSSAPVLPTHTDNYDSGKTKQKLPSADTAATAQKEKEPG